MRRTLTLTALVIALAACNAERPAEPAATPPSSAGQQTPQTPAGQPAPTPLPPAEQPAPTPPAPAPASGLARFDGYGDMRFGMTAEEATKAWGGELNGKPGKGEVCYYLHPVSNPSPAYFAFMIEDDKLVRYDVGNDKEVAPGGGKVGMDSDQIRTLYAGRIEERPHKYVDGGKYLRIKANDDSGGVLVFETDAAGKVTEWRAGLPPQVDYIEGCS
jgi:hypothetical protein